MPVLMQTNVSSLESQRNLSKSQVALSKSFNKLSSGYRINTAADDAAGLAISEGMRAQIRSYAVAERNANDGISMSQVAEGALGEISGILARMRELAMQGANGSLTGTDRGYLETEYAALRKEIARIQVSTKFNGKQMLGASAVSITFQVGLNATTSDQITIAFGGFSLSTLLASTNTLAGSTASASLAALSIIDNALTEVSTQRARFGAAMNRLETTTSNIATMRLNMSAANSRIRDVDVAEETATMSKNQVLSQAGAAVLAQANQIPQIAISLLRG
jgi:flagellin